QPRLALNQEVVSLHAAIRATLAVAADVAGDEPGISLAQARRSEARALRGPWHEVLHEYIRARDHAMKQRRLRFEVEHDRFLAPVQPNEIGAFAMRDPVVAPC